MDTAFSPVKMSIKDPTLPGGRRLAKHNHSNIGHIGKAPERGFVIF